MDWIEQLLHVSPDGGSGALEAIYTAVAACAVGSVAWWRMRRRRDRATDSKDRE